MCLQCGQCAFCDPLHGINRKLYNELSPEDQKRYCPDGPCFEPIYSYGIERPFPLDKEVKCDVLTYTKERIEWANEFVTPTVINKIAKVMGENLD